MSPRGGKRPNQTGRPPRAGMTARYRHTVWFTEDELGAITAALGDGEPLASFIRTAAMKEARRRK